MGARSRGVPWTGCPSEASGSVSNVILHPRGGFAQAAGLRDTTILCAVTKGVPDRASRPQMSRHQTT